jgi:hypothetical protein
MSHASTTTARWALRGLALLSVATMPLASGCPEPTGPNGMKECTPEGLATARKWSKRAGEGYKAGDLEDANDSIKSAMNSCPADSEIRLMAARIALARLDFKGALAALEQVEGSEAASLRARAYWYSDDLTHTAEELSAALEDPDFKDPWAKPVRELAGTQGSGRHPFQLREGSARLVELHMPRDLGYALMLPIEIDGQVTMALAVTGVPEVILDSKTRTNPGWVSVKFGTADRWMEFRDVPALVNDLTPYTSQQQVPIGALIGVNFLRRLHLTFDRRGDQFIIRKEEPPPPPAFTRVPVAYVRGGGMIVRGTLKKEFEVTSGLWVNTGDPFTLALPDPTWKKLGVDPTTLPTYASLAHGKLNDVRIGGLDLGPVESVAGITGIEDKLSQIDVDVAGAMGVGFLTAMRVTLADGGRALWLETDEDTSMVLAPPVPTQGAVAPPPPVPTVSPSSSGKPPPAPTSSVAPKPAASTAPTAKPAPTVSAKPMPAPSAVPTPKPVPTAKPAPSASTK